MVFRKLTYWSSLKINLRHLYHAKGALFGAFIKKIGKKRKNEEKILYALFFESLMLWTLLTGLNVSLWVFLSPEYITEVNIHSICSEIIFIPIGSGYS